MKSRGTRAAILAAFVLVAAIVTFPQVTRLGTAVADHPDPYFSIWRLGWVAHQVAHRPLQLFESNIFYPEATTFVYSDAMLVPALMTSPLLWLHTNPVLVYNVAMLAALALSGFTMFLLAFELTGDAGAAFVAGVIYGFAPYRLEQFIHLEMEMVFWIPLALLLVHRVMVAQRLSDGILLGLAVAAQFLSGMYGAMCFGVCLVVLGIALVVATPPSRPMRLAGVAIVGVIVAGAILLPYALPYMRVQALAGPRGIQEIQHYDAAWTNYLAATPTNRLWGWTSARFGGEELNLFPGLTATLCALVGLFRGKSRTRFAYFVMLLFAAEASRGFGGFTYPFLYQDPKPFQALRVPSRFDLIVNVALGVLAASGVAWITAHVRGTWRRATASLIAVALVIEYASAPVLATVAPISAADRWLATLPAGVLVETPLPTMAHAWPNSESRFMYEGMAHWYPTVNGYSGILPYSYFEMVTAMQDFPSAASLNYLRSRHVHYVMVRGGFYPPGEWAGTSRQFAPEPGADRGRSIPSPGQRAHLYVVARRLPLNSFTSRSDRSRVQERASMARTTGVAFGVLAAGLSLAACEMSKSSNPLSPSVAGPLPGVQITAPSTVDPQNGAKIAVDKQPVTLSISNAGSNGPRPLSYGFDVATDANFNTKVFSRNGVKPGDSGKTIVTLSDPLATGRTYFWRTQAQDGANTGPYSSVASFSVYTPIVINDPAPVLPAQGATVDSIRPVITVTDATHTGPVGAITYLLEIADSDSFANKITATAAEQATQTKLNTPSDLLYAKTYYWHVRAYDPTTLGPFSTTRSFTTPAAPTVATPAPSGPIPAANDGANLALATVYNSPQDIASWPATATITRLDLGTGGVHIDFTKRDGAGSWPDVAFGAPGDSLEYTLWIVVNVNGRWYTSGCIEFWRGLDRNGGPPQNYGSSWDDDPIRWGAMAGYQPQPGEMVGFFVTAGDERNNGAFLVKERSNVVLVPFPSGSGVFTF